MTLNSSSGKSPTRSSARRQTKVRSGKAATTGQASAPRFQTDLLPLEAFVAKYLPRQFFHRFTYKIVENAIVEVSEPNAKGEKEERTLCPLDAGLDWCQVSELVEDESCLTGYFVGSKRAIDRLRELNDRRARTAREFDSIGAAALDFIEDDLTK